MTSEETTTLTSANIWSVGKANEIFGKDKSLIVARPGSRAIRFPFYFWFTIPEGFYALVSRHGALEYTTDKNGNETPLWPAGYHYGPAWLKVSHLVTKQSVIFNTPIRGCRTKDNVRVNIDIAIVFRIMGEEDPENVVNFVFKVTTPGLQQQLIDAQAEAVRALARSVNHTDVFGIRAVSQEELAGVRSDIAGNQEPAVAPFIINQSEELESLREEKIELDTERDYEGDHDDLDPIEARFNTETGASVTQAMKDRLNRQFKPQGVEILDVIIQQITLPDVIQQQMSNKTFVISQNAEQRMQQKFDLQTLRQKENIKSLQQKHKDMMSELIANGNIGMNKEKIILQEQNVVGKLKLLEIEVEKSIETAKIDAVGQQEEQTIRNKTRLKATQITEQSKAEAAKRRAESKSKVDKIQAKADFECSKLSAEGDKTRFQAEGISAPLNRELNEHITCMKKLEAQTALAMNKKLIITGTAGGEAANRLILTEATLNDAQKNKTSQSASEKSGILSQLAVASGKAQVNINMWDASTRDSGRGPDPSKYMKT
mmetsp:Transcript_27775/g.31734  ORF Transcript_27775/g.31734 Transcript_27775/m.31734 type:complete len:544 (+) Transcript_27775:94-1725(+)